MTEELDARRGRTVGLRLAQPAALVAIMWAVFLLDAVLPGSFNRVAGIESWAFRGLDGVLLSPLLHGDLAHLIANTVPFAILAGLAALDGVGRFWAVTGIIAGVAGVGTWVVNAPGTLTVGASGLVFGYFGYLLLRAFVAPSLGRGMLYAVIAIAVGVAYGGTMFSGILLAGDGVSWQAHLFGALGGAGAAFALRPRRPARPRRR